MTACGNFGIASTSTGELHMWNMQSGIKRKTFSVGLCPPEAASRFQTSTAKQRQRCITGLATDSLNRVVIASTLDGTINVVIYFFLVLKVTECRYSIPTVFRFPHYETGTRAGATFDGSLLVTS